MKHLLIQDLSLQASKLLHIFLYVLHIGGSRTEGQNSISGIRADGKLESHLSSSNTIFYTPSQKLNESLSIKVFEKIRAHIIQTIGHNSTFTLPSTVILKLKFCAYDPEPPISRYS